MLFTWETITEVEDLEYFIACYLEEGGFPLSLECLRNKDVMLCKRNGKVVAGVLFNSQGPFRSFQDIPDDQLSKVQSAVQLEDCFETMCFWMTPAYRGKLKSLVIWTSLVRIIIKYPKRQLLVSTVSDGLYRMYRPSGASVIYRGEIFLSQEEKLPKYVFHFSQKRYQLAKVWLNTAIMRSAVKPTVRLVKLPLRKLVFRDGC